MHRTCRRDWVPPKGIGLDIVLNYHVVTQDSATDIAQEHPQSTQVVAKEGPWPKEAKYGALVTSTEPRVCKGLRPPTGQ